MVICNTTVWWPSRALCFALTTACCCSVCSSLQLLRPHLFHRRAKIWSGWNISQLPKLRIPVCFYHDLTSLCCCLSRMWLTLFDPFDHRQTSGSMDLLWCLTALGLKLDLTKSSQPDTRMHQVRLYLKWIWTSTLRSSFYFLVCDLKWLVRLTISKF